MNSSADPLQFLADIVANSASNNSPEKSDGGGGDFMLTQPPEVIANADDSAAMNHEPSCSGGATDPSAAGAAKPQSSKRKSKLKKPTRQASKSVLETMSPETTAALTAAAVAPKAASSNAPATSTSASARKKSPPKKPAKNPSKLLSQITIGGWLEVYWPGDDKYYPGVVTAHCPNPNPGRGKRKGHVYTIHYEDGDMENVDLATEKFRFISTASANAKSPPPSLPSKPATTTATQSSTVIEAVAAQRTTLDELRQTTINNPKDRLSIKQILQILRKLDQRSDIDFSTLYHTGIGKTVNKLVKHANGKISEAATPLLMKWRMIDESTPEGVKFVVTNKQAAEMESHDSDQGAAIEDEENGGARRSPRTKAAKAAYSPVTHAANSISVVDLTSSPPSSKVGASSSIVQSKQQKIPPCNSMKQESKATATMPAATKVSPTLVHNNNDATDGQGEQLNKKPTPSPPELASSSSFKENSGAGVQSAKTKPKSRKTSNTAARVSLSPAKPAPTEGVQPAKTKPKSQEILASAEELATKAAPATAKQTGNVNQPNSTAKPAPISARVAKAPVKPSNTAAKTGATREAATATAKQPNSNAKPAPTPAGVAKASAKASNTTAKTSATKGAAAVTTKQPNSSAKPASTPAGVAKASVKPSNTAAKSSTTKGAATATAKQPNSNAKPAATSAGVAKASAKASNSTAKTSATKGAATSTAKQPNSNAKFASASINQMSNAKQPSSNTTATSTATKQQPPKKKKKRTYHDQILYTMLTSCKPYSLKSLAKEAGTTPEALNHAMLSFLDKKLVICKEFPSKKGSTREPKKLYWANPMSLSEVENAGSKSGKAKSGGGAVVKELTKLLSTSQEINEAREERGQLERQHRGLQDELTPLLAIPTMQELDNQMSAEEQTLQAVQDKIQAVKDRMANVAKAASAPPSRPVGYAAGYNPYNRLAKPPPTGPQTPTTIKRKINQMLGEYKSRKRKCMDFVDELSEAMEKKTKDVTGDKVLALDTDEMEWGYYEDGATGKVYGNPKPKKKQFGLVGRRQLGGKKEEETMAIVKIPAKYKDV